MDLVGQVDPDTAMHRSGQVGLLHPDRSDLEGQEVLEDLGFPASHTCAANLHRRLVCLMVLVVLVVLVVHQLRRLAVLVAPATLEPRRCYLCDLAALEVQVALDPQDFHCQLASALADLEGLAVLDSLLARTAWRQK